MDDENDLELLIRQKFRHKIRSKELYFEFAHNGVEALERMKGGEFDLVLTDINMPEMDGLTLLVKIKEQNRFYKAIVVSAYSDMQNIRTPDDSFCPTSIGHEIGNIRKLIPRFSTAHLEHRPYTCLTLEGLHGRAYRVAGVQ